MENNKIGILTVHKSANVGSFLQAYALGEAIKSIADFEVLYVDNKSRKPLRMMLSDIKNSVLKGNFAKAAHYFALYSEFIKEQRIFNEISAENASSLSKVVLGSDEIWNMAKKNMREFPSFFGVGINCNKIAYAPTVNNAKAEDFNGIDYIKSALDDISDISVRDSYSKNLLEAQFCKQCRVVCDPTWLLKPEDYIKRSGKQRIKNKYILIYMYNGGITQADIDSIRAFAEEKKLLLVSANNSHNWCDKSIITSPFDFCRLVNEAEYIITNTFHGTIFSILFNKRFASFAVNNNKINEVLNQTGLNDALTDSESLGMVLDRQHNWNLINGEIEKLRFTSKEFLKNALEK